MSEHCMRVYFGHIDPLNPGCGVDLKVEQDGKTILHTANHPVTGKPLTLEDCPDVARAYLSYEANRPKN